MLLVALGVVLAGNLLLKLLAWFQPDRAAFPSILKTAVEGEGAE